MDILFLLYLQMVVLSYNKLMLIEFDMQVSMQFVPLEVSPFDSQKALQIQLSHPCNRTTRDCN